METQFIINYFKGIGYRTFDNPLGNAIDIYSPEDTDIHFCLDLEEEVVSFHLYYDIVERPLGTFLNIDEFIAWISEKVTTLKNEHMRKGMEEAMQNCMIQDLFNEKK